MPREDWKNDPPRIILSKVPALLILIDGDPVYRPIEGTPYTRVVNTPAFLLFDSAAGTFYLDGGNWRMTASSLTGPWTPAANPPQDLAEIKQQLTKDEEKESSEAPAAPSENPPAAYVNSVHPGFIWMPLLGKLGAELPGGAAAFPKFLDSKHPLGHVGDPDDIGWGIVYLTSDESKFVTGSELVMDGGYTAQ